MPWRPLHLVRALSTAGLAGSLMFLGGAVAAGRAPGDEPSTLPESATTTETVDVLKAAADGDLKVVARGHGQDKVRLEIENVSEKRLNVVIPPGLVAAGGVAQGAMGGGGFQSMGLGAIDNRPGSFGRFEGAAVAGFRSIPVNGPATPALTVPAGETVEVAVPGVCLNYGVAAPTARDVFTLMDVDQYTPDARVRKALRGLATLGTSQGVAQAVMWRICDGISFEQLATRERKTFNEHELALAARFVAAVDESAAGTVDPASLTAGRVFVNVRAEGAAALAEVDRLAAKLDGLLLFGLPITLVEGDDAPVAEAPAVFVKLVVGQTDEGRAMGRMLVGATPGGDQWRPLGKAVFHDHASLAVLDSRALASLMERELAASFVGVKAARRTTTGTTLRVENRLPFTIAGLRLRAGTSAGSPQVPFDAVGIGPARSAMLPIQAANAQIVGVELNGL